MRYARPEASWTQRCIVSAVQAGDEGFAFNVPALGAAAGGAFVGVLGGVSESPFFLLLLLVPLVVGWIYLTYFLASVDIYYGRNMRYLNRAERLMDLIRGSHTEYLAVPVHRKIFDHTRIHRINDRFESDDQKKCDSCAARIAVLEKLIPADRSADDNTDILQAQEYITIRKELD